MNTFFTRSGDDGYTGLLGEGRIPKYHPRTETVGTLDEASAALGVARSVCQVDLTKTSLLTVQRDLYGLMAEVSATPENAARFRKIDLERVRWLESQIDAVSAQVQPPKDFIVPGDTPAGAALDFARTVVRRAERQLAYLLLQKEVENEALLQYLNRLSSLCFVFELIENQAAGISLPTLAKSTP